MPFIAQWKISSSLFHLFTDLSNLKTVVRWCALASINTTVYIRLRASASCRQGHTLIPAIILRPSCLTDKITLIAYPAIFMQTRWPWGWFVLSFDPQPLTERVDLIATWLFWNPFLMVNLSKSIIPVQGCQETYMPAHLFVQGLKGWRIAHVWLDRSHRPNRGKWQNLSPRPVFKSEAGNFLYE